MKRGKIYRLAYLEITGAMRTTSAVAMECLLHLPPLLLMIMGIARMAYLRLQKLPNAGLRHNNIVHYNEGNLL